MRILFVPLRGVGALAFALLAMSCAATPTRTENLLATAGFHNVQASSPRQQQLLASLPAGEMSNVLKNGRTWVVFPNHASNSAFVGTPAQFATYRQLVSAQAVSDRNLRVAQMNSRPPWSGPGWNDPWGGPWAWR